MEQGSPTISLEIERELRRVIIDTGSSVSILQHGVTRNDIGVTAIKPYGKGLKPRYTRAAERCLHGWKEEIQI
jgi:hypothetical protein